MQCSTARDSGGAGCCTVRGGTALGRGVQRCTILREGLLQRLELRCRILHAVEALSAAQDQGRESAGSQAPALHGGEVLGAAQRRGDCVG